MAYANIYWSEVLLLAPSLGSDTIPFLSIVCETLLVSTSCGANAGKVLFSIYSIAIIEPGHTRDHQYMTET